MADRDREYIGGWLVVEDWRLPWDCAVGDHDVKVMGCGELGAARWALFLIAWKEAARRDLDTQLRAFAERVVVTYSPTQRRSTPHKVSDPDETGATS